MEPCLFHVLQSEPAVIEAIANDISKGLSTSQIVFFSLLTYFLGALVQYVVSWLLHKSDLKNDRKMKIAEISITEEVAIYRLLIGLRGFQKHESMDLLNSIQSAQLRLSNDRILFPEKFYRAAQEVLDYFSIVAGDYTRKDVSKEVSLFDVLYKSFHN